MRRKYRLSKRHLKIWNSYIDGLDDDTVSTYLFELMLTPSLKTFDWKSVLDTLGFDDEETPFVPRPRYLHLTGYGPHFSAFCSETLFDLAPFSTRPDIDLAPHPDDLTLEELGDDFSNLIRSHRLTPTTNSKLFNIRLDPTMFIEDPQACSSADPLLNIILDTGASHGLTMSSDDFVEITYGNFGSMSTAANENKFPIIGAGIVAYDAISENGDLIRWTFPANLCKAAGSRLCSPQVCADYLNLDRRFPSFESNHDVYASIKTDAIGGRLTVPIDHNVNLPLVKAKNVHVSTKVHSHANDPQCRCSTTNWCRCPLCTKPHDTPRTTLADALNQQVVDPDDVLSTSNENLTTAQKHLLLDHQRLGHLNMRQIQNLYHCHETSPDSCLKPKGTGCLTCPLPKCRACLLGKAKRRPTKSTVKRPRSDAGHIPHDPSKLEPGDLVSIDHYESSVRGRLYHTKGRERAEHRFCGGTLFFDHASRAIFVYHQVSLGGSDTIRSKFSLETFASQVGRTIRRYHSDNGILTSDAFERSLQADHLEVKPLHTVSGVGAHHQNGGAERAIQTVTSMARTMMIHCHLHWPDGFSPNLWPMALDYAVWIYNHVPREDSTLSPMELFTGVKEHCSQLRRLRVWGCPSYVLDPRLQDGKKVPKWSPRARQGQFLGFSTQHSTTIGLIRNLTTNHISPQFHVVHDELFHTVHSSWEAPLGPIDLPDFFTRDTYLEDHCSDIDGDLPPLDSSWAPPSRSVAANPPIADEGERTPRIDPQPAPASPNPPSTPPRTPRTPSTPMPPVELGEPELEPPVDLGEPELEPPVELGEPELEPPVELGEPELDSGPRRSRRQRAAPRRFPDPERHVTFDLPTSEWSNHHSLRRFNTFSNDMHRFFFTQAINTDPSSFASYANHLNWDHCSNPDHEHPSYFHDRSYQLQSSATHGIIDDWDPRYFASKSFDADNPSYFDVRHMDQEEQEKWFIAMDRELDELEEKGTFTLVPRRAANGKEIVDSMWTLKRKRLPDGTLSRYKARLVVRGDQQKATFDKEDTFAPVIDWPAVRLLLILALQHDLATASIDFKNAFVQSSLPEPIYVNLPHGYGEGHGDKVLQVHKSLYGDCRAPRLWYNYLKARLKELGLTTDGNDPCLFCQDGCIMVTYVDDAIICGKDQETVDRLLAGLTQLQMDFDHLGDLPTYLGVQITRQDDGSMVLTQPHLTKSIIAALGLTDSCPKQTPATRTLGKDTHKPPLNESFNYRSVVGMLLYLGNNTRPDCAFAIHQAARFSNDPRCTHGEALKRIGRYLQGTHDKGLILKPSKDLNLDCYVDADFAGIWGNEDAQDPSSVRSRTGFLISLGGSPVTWSSKLQTEIALSTMEAEYIAASTSMRTLLPLQRQLQKMTKQLHLAQPGTTSITTIWEDNQAALKLATKDPPRMTPRSKHIGVKYHWFRSKLHDGPNGIRMKAIATDAQLGDCFTKPLDVNLFTTSRKKIMGW